MVPDTIDNVAPHMDRLNFAALLLIPFAPLISIFLGWYSGSNAIALVTAVTAFVAIYRLRKPDGDRPEVMQSFSTVQDSDHMDFGLENYGSEGILFLQVRVEKASSGDTLLELEPRDIPVHLSAGEFIGFLHDDRITDDRFLREIESFADKEGPREMVHLYYTFKPCRAMRVPEYMADLMDRPDENVLGKLVDKEDTPRRMELSKIQRWCSI